MLRFDKNGMSSIAQYLKLGNDPINMQSLSQYTIIIAGEEETSVNLQTQFGRAKIQA